MERLRGTHFHLYDTKLEGFVSNILNTVKDQHKFKMFVLKNDIYFQIFDYKRAYTM